MCAKRDRDRSLFSAGSPGSRARRPSNCSRCPWMAAAMAKSATSRRPARSVVGQVSLVSIQGSSQGEVGGQIADDHREFAFWLGRTAVLPVEYDKAAVGQPPDVLDVQIPMTGPDQLRLGRCDRGIKGDQLRKPPGQRRRPFGFAPTGIVEQPGQSGLAQRLGEPGRHGSLITGRGGRRRGQMLHARQHPTGGVDGGRSARRLIQPENGQGPPRRGAGQLQQSRVGVAASREATTPGGQRGSYRCI